MNLLPVVYRVQMAPDDARQRNGQLSLLFSVPVHQIVAQPDSNKQMTYMFVSEHPEKVAAWVVDTVTKERLAHSSPSARAIP